jgi:hypothetical protein
LWPKVVVMLSPTVMALPGQLYKKIA